MEYPLGIVIADVWIQRAKKASASARPLTPGNDCSPNMIGRFSELTAIWNQETQVRKNVKPPLEYYAA
jgi:hypothetical protein